jgi:hypothetical protein
MRCTQFIGLNERASKFLKKNATERPAIVCKKCGEVVSKEMDRSVYDHAFGMFDEKIPLHSYKLKDGRTVKEYVQADPWSSGPCIFTALKDAKTKKAIKGTLWKVAEIREYAG